MEQRKDGINQNPDGQSSVRSSDYARVNDEDNLDTREISNDIEEGDEDYDDEELTEDDFEIDGDDEEEDEAII